jgi:hypothetical protein
MSLTERKDLYDAALERLADYAKLLADQYTEIEQLRASLDEAVEVMRPFDGVSMSLFKRPGDETTYARIEVPAAAIPAAHDFITKHGGERE